MSILLNGTIPVSDLARANPGPNDAMVGVDEASGAPRRFPLSSLPLTAPQQAALDAMQEQVDQLNAGTIAESTWARLISVAPGINQPVGAQASIPRASDPGSHVDPIKDGDQVVPNGGLYVRRTTAVNGWEWLQADTLAQKADKSEVNAIAVRFDDAQAVEDISLVDTDNYSETDGYMLSWFESDGTPRFGVQIPSVEIEGRFEADIDGVAFVETDETGQYVFRSTSASGVVKDYPDELTISDVPSFIPTPAGYPIVGSQGMLLKDFSYSWWCTGIYQWDNHLVIGGIASNLNGFHGKLKVATANYGSESFDVAVIGDDLWMEDANRGLDDHDRAAVCVDPRPGATYPITVAQSPHGTFPGNIQHWQSTTISARDISERYVIGTGGQRTYNSLYRVPSRPDEIWNFGRFTGSSGNWSVVRSLDNGMTWGEKHFFMNSASFAYPLVRPCLDGSGVLITIHTNPGQTGGRTIPGMKLTWDGLLTDLAGTVITANIFASGNAQVEPFNSGTIIHDPDTAGNGDRIRMTDLREVALNVWQLVYLQGQGVSFNSSSLNIRTIDLTTPGTPVIGAPVYVAPGGVALSDYQKNYLAGGCVIARDKIVRCAIKPTDYPEQGVVDLWDVSSGTPVLIDVIDEPGDYKPARPEVSIVMTANTDGTISYNSVGNFISYNKFREYPDFFDWRGDTRVANIINYQ